MKFSKIFYHKKEENKRVKLAYKKINIPVPDECVEELYNLWDDMNRNCTMINQYKFWKYVATFCPESTREDCRCDINTDKILKPYITVRETTL